MTPDSKNADPSRSSQPALSPPPLPGLLMAGFECSSHRLASGRRLDLLASTKHDRFASLDYQRVASIGVRTVRDGVRWHQIDPGTGHYDFTKTIAMIEAAEEAGLHVIWDLCHYGWPDDLPIFRPEFVGRFARFTAAFIHTHKAVTGRAPWIAPINEISFFAWAGGQIAMFNPCKRARGDELKVQLARSTIAAIEAAWKVDPTTRILHTDPLIRVVGDPTSKRAQNRAAAYHAAQFQAFDMISGRLHPELGGRPEYLDVIGLNYYPRNQWMVRKLPPGKKNPPHLDRTDPHYLPLRYLLREVSDRYRRPLILSETGAEGIERAPWLRYVCKEVAEARLLGIPIGAVCWYPILNHPGWTNNRHCYNGLWDYANSKGEREIDASLLAEWEQVLRSHDPQTHDPLPTMPAAGQAA